jgi:hypothetical protein
MHLRGQSVSPGGGVIGEHFAGYRGALGRVLLLSFYVFPLFREISRVCVFKSPSDTLISHDWWNLGMQECHPGPAFAVAGALSAGCLPS